MSKVYRAPVDLSIPVPTCRHCGSTGIITNVEARGDNKIWVHDREASWGSRIDCVPLIVRLKMSPAEAKQAEQYKFELLRPEEIAKGVMESNPIASWKAKSWN